MKIVRLVWVVTLVVAAMAVVPASAYRGGGSGDPMWTAGRPESFGRGPDWSKKDQPEPAEGSEIGEPYSWSSDQEQTAPTVPQVPCEAAPRSPRWESEEATQPTAGPQWGEGPKWKADEPPTSTTCEKPTMKPTAKTSPKPAPARPVASATSVAPAPKPATPSPSPVAPVSSAPVPSVPAPPVSEQVAPPVAPLPPAPAAPVAPAEPEPEPADSWLWMLIPAAIVVALIVLYALYRRDVAAFFRSHTTWGCPWRCGNEGIQYQQEECDVCGRQIRWVDGSPVVLVEPEPETATVEPIFGRAGVENIQDESGSEENVNNDLSDVDITLEGEAAAEASEPEPETATVEPAEPVEPQQDGKSWLQRLLGSDVGE